MKKCRIYDIGGYVCADGLIKNDRLYRHGEDDTSCFPEEMDLAREECDHGLIQFAVDGKWGFADISTGEIKLEPIWDYAGPFYRGYAHVSLGAKVQYSRDDELNEGGKHGYIDKTGKIIIPLEYDAATNLPYNDCLNVARNNKWGMIDYQNRTVIPLEWDNFLTHQDGLIFVGIEVPCELHIGPIDKMFSAIFGIPVEATSTHRTKWGVFDRNNNLVLKPELDEIPKDFKWSGYYLLQKGRKYGVMSRDGQLISEIKLFKKDAIELIRTFSR